MFTGKQFQLKSLKSDNQHLDSESPKGFLWKLVMGFISLSNTLSKNNSHFPNEEISIRKKLKDDHHPKARKLSSTYSDAQVVPKPLYYMSHYHRDETMK